VKHICSFSTAVALAHLPELLRLRIRKSGYSRAAAEVPNKISDTYPICVAVHIGLGRHGGRVRGKREVIAAAVQLPGGQPSAHDQRGRLHPNWRTRRGPSVVPAKSHSINFPHPGGSGKLPRIPFSRNQEPCRAQLRNTTRLDHRSSAISSWIASITACGWSTWIVCVLPGTTTYEEREESDVKSFCICDQAVAIGPGSLVS
jgi:hypothetical protein